MRSRDVTTLRHAITDSGPREVQQHFSVVSDNNISHLSGICSPEEEEAEMSNMMKIVEMTRKTPTPVNESQTPSQPAASDDTLQDPFSFDALTRVSYTILTSHNQSDSIIKTVKTKWN